MKTSNAKSSNVVAINAKGDKAIADNAHAADRAKVLDAIDTAEDLLGTALVEGLRMTVRYGRTSAAEVAQHYTRCGSPDVYASWFNLGDRAQQIVGIKLAMDAIDRAIASGKGSMFQRAREALKGVCDAAKSQGVKTLNAKAGAAAVKSAVTTAQAGAEARKAAKPAATAKRGTKSPDSATLAAAAIASGQGHREIGAALKLVSQNASKLAALQGREALQRDALKAIQEACEKWALLTK